ncbi:hypothetical protein F5Y03DRAFT_103281 [Xylaria venustula]|nr:hypothetical protein F5Y03DRAFT_103281 [Xylaria venustula]
MSDQPPPPPPHGTNPRRPGPNMPPGKYDIFIIPPHSSGAGFLYLPSLKPNVNSFAAGFASALVLVVLFQSMAPAFRVWYRNFQGMGNMGMLLLVIAVGVGAWSVGRIQNEKGPSSGNRGDSRHSWSYNPGDNGHSGGSHSNSGPPPHSRSPDPDGPPPPPPPHGTPPPRSGPSPNPGGSDKPRSSWQERPQEHSEERPREHSQERPRERRRKRPEERPEEREARPEERPEKRPEKRPEENPKEHPKERPQERPQQRPAQERPEEKPQAESTKGTWERAREETRRKEEERKAKEAEQRKKDEIARRIKELRAKEAKERARREQEAKERREKEAREKEEREREIRERLEKEARIREEREREIREQIEKEERIRKERAEKEAREARERQEKEMQEAREKQEREAREKEQQAKEQREREQQEKARKEKELREKRLQEARERELRERLEREKTLRETLEREVKEREARERETKEREAREREAKEREVRERIAARLKEVQAAKAAQEAKAKAQEAETPRRGTYAFSSVGEKTNPWPNGKPPTPAPSTTRSTATPSVAPTAAPSTAPSAPRSAAPSAAPSAASNSTRRPPPPTAQSFRGTDDDAYSYRPYDQPKSHTRRRSGETIFTESSYAASQSTSRTTPPPSMRGPYTTKDPDKIVIKAVYGFLNQFSKTPASQLLSGIGNVTDGLILRITTEGLFIDDDVRGVPQREWDVKAWTLKLMEVWCPAHTTADSTASPRVTNKSAPPRFKFSARGQSKALMGDEADSYLTELLHACKDDCRMGPHGGSDAASARGNSQGGEWKHRGLHVLRATIRDQEGKRYLFVLGEEEGWKVAVGLQRLRKGTQVRQLGIQSMPLAEARNSVEMLGW